MADAPHRAQRRQFPFATWKPRLRIAAQHAAQMIADRASAWAAPCWHVTPSVLNRVPSSAYTSCAHRLVFFVGVIAPFCWHSTTSSDPSKAKGLHTKISPTPPPSPPCAVSSSDVPDPSRPQIVPALLLPPARGAHARARARARTRTRTRTAHPHDPWAGQIGACYLC